MRHHNLRFLLSLTEIITAWIPAIYAIRSSLVSSVIYRRRIIINLSNIVLNMVGPSILTYILKVKYI